MANLPYDRRDADSILEYLKQKAEIISNGKWTDFSNGDIGTVLLKLIAYVADMNNYQIDKGLAELYIDTLTERDSAISLVKLIGYEPRGYKSARVELDVSLKPGVSVENGTEIPEYTQFTDASRQLFFYNISKGRWMDNRVSMIVYEGEYNVYNKSIDDVDTNARLFLDEFQIDPETMTITIAGDKLNRVENVNTDISNNLCYSVHVGDKSTLYIQLPANYKDFIPYGANLKIECLVTRGEAGNIGSHILDQFYENPGYIGVSTDDITVDNNLESTGGQDPETIEEIQKGAPLYASTMNTLVTLEDIQLSKYEVDGVADIIALDYNSPESGLVQPADAYKVNIYVLPIDGDYIVDPGGKLTQVGENLKAFIDERRLTSIIVNYKNVEIITPDIKVVAYINKYDLRAETLQSDIIDIILKNYDRSTFKIGDGIYSSKISKQILDEIDYCNYIEVQLPDDSYIPTKMQFLKVNRDNITIEIIEE